MKSLKQLCIECIGDPLWIQSDKGDKINPNIPEEIYKKIMGYRSEELKKKYIDDITEEEYRYRGKILFEYSHYICNMSNVYDESYDRVKVKYKGNGIYTIDMKWEQRSDYYGKYVHSKGVWNRGKNELWIEYVVDRYEYEKIFKNIPKTYISNIMISNK